jgi:murein DD-endopeptidase MepM/ murein hydrolase activator NlpD
VTAPPTPALAAQRAVHDAIGALARLLKRTPAQTAAAVAAWYHGGPAPAPEPHAPALPPPVTKGPVHLPHSPIASPSSIGGVHDTAGLAGFPAVDVFAEPGTPVLAPDAGEVSKLSGHDPKLGAIDGPGGPLGWSVYITSPRRAVYYLTHLGAREVKLGQHVAAGERIGTVADYDRFGRASHVHVGYHAPPEV